MADLVRPFVRPSSRVLDVGGYCGDFREFLPPLSPAQYTVIDHDREALAVAARRGLGVCALDLDVELIPLALGPVDLLVCTETLEHLKDPRAHLRRFRELLSPSGRALVSLPNENTLYHRFMSVAGFGIDDFAFEPFKHLHFPTIRQARALLRTYFRIDAEAFYINPGMRMSRGEALGRILQLFPDRFWQVLADVAPSLFARGAIYLGTPR